MAIDVNTSPGNVRFQFPLQETPGTTPVTEEQIYAKTYKITVNYVVKPLQSL